MHNEFVVVRLRPQDFTEEYEYAAKYLDVQRIANIQNAYRIHFYLLLRLVYIASGIYILNRYVCVCVDMGACVL